MTSKTNLQNGITRKGFLAGIAYEDFNGHKLDRKMLELLRRY